MTVGTEFPRANRNRLTTWLAWAAAALTVLEVAIGLYLALVEGARSPWAAQAALGGAVSVAVDVSTVAFAVIGLLVVIRRRHNPIGWLLLVGAFSMGLGSSGAAYVYYGQQAGPLLDWRLVAWVRNLVYIPALTSLFLLVPLLFPNGHWLSPRWRRFAWLSLFIMSINLLFAAFAPGPLNSLGASGLGDNPFALLPDSLITPERREDIQTILFVCMIAVLLVANASVLLRWRRSQGEERQQVKWVILFLGYFVSAYLPLEIYGAVYPPFFNSIYYDLVLLVLWLGYPLVLGLAILKYRLYDVDLIIRRTVVYGLLTASLLTIYYGSVVLVQAVITAGSGQDSSVAVAVATLVAAALFSPLRGRLQAIIDRRFFRRKYDAALALGRFAAAARDEVDLDQLTVALLQVVNETVQPASATLWLKEQRS